MRRAVVFLVSLCVSLLLLEVVLRTVFSERYGVRQDERSLSYAHHPELGWFPVPGDQRVIHGTHFFEVQHNDRGFRDGEHGPKQKPRLLVLGDSFVWGFDAQRDERFTHLLQEKMPHWEVLNLGVSGYGSDQALLLLQREIAFYEPDVVLLVFSESNDRADNTHNRTYGHYYKPYFEKTDQGLELRGTPVPKPLPFLQRDHPWLFESYLVRAVVDAIHTLRHPSVEVPDRSEELVLAMRDLSHRHGAGFALGIQGKNPMQPWADVSQRERIPVAQLANPHRQPRFGGHWTPKGHEVVAQRLYALLSRAGWVRPEEDAP